jgi:hypothetical protein
MHSVFIAEGAEFFVLHPAGLFFLIFGGSVISPFTLTTG